jgi:hypothetical protein
MEHAQSIDGAARAIEPMRRLAALHFQIEGTEAQLKALKAEAESLEQVCLATFVEMGIDSLPLAIDGQPVSVHLHRTLRTTKADGVEMQAAVDALKDAGLGWLVREQYVAQTLGSWVREELAAGRVLPPTLTTLFDIREITDVRVTRTTRQESASSRAAKTLRAQSKTE